MTLPVEMEEEYSKWQNSIEDFSQQNALLKYRLSEIVDKNEEKDLLQIAEYFQNELVLEDDVLKRLRIELREYADMKHSGYDQAQDIIVKHNALKNDFLNFEKKFLNLSEEFNKKMTESYRY